MKALDLEGTPITDSGLKHLFYLNNLKYLDLRKTGVTKSEIDNLQKALPDCAIKTFSISMDIFGHRDFILWYAAFIFVIIALIFNLPSKMLPSPAALRNTLIICVILFVLDISIIPIFSFKFFIKINSFFLVTLGLIAPMFLSLNDKFTPRDTEFNTKTILKRFSMRQFLKGNVLITKISIIAILFFSFTWLGFMMMPASVGFPQIVSYTGPFVCPEGYEEINSEITIKQWDLPGKQITGESNTLCIGKSGQFKPNEGIVILMVMIIYIFLSGLLITIGYIINTLLREKAYNRLRFILIPGLFTLILLLLSPLISSIAMSMSIWFNS